MYYQTDMCCLCLESEIKYFYHVSKYYEKINTALPNLVFEDKYDEYLLCMECCNTIDLVYEFNKKCIKNLKIFFNYTSLLNSSNNKNSDLNINLSDIRRILTNKKNVFKLQETDIDLHTNHELEYSKENQKKSTDYSGQNPKTSSTSSLQITNVSNSDNRQQSKESFKKFQSEVSKEVYSREKAGECYQELSPSLDCIKQEETDELTWDSGELIDMDIKIDATEIKLEYSDLDTIIEAPDLINTYLGEDGKSKQDKSGDIEETTKDVTDKNINNQEYQTKIINEHNKVIIIKNPNQSVASKNDFSSTSRHKTHRVAVCVRSASQLTGKNQQEESGDVEEMIDDKNLNKQEYQTKISNKDNKVKFPLKTKKCSSKQTAHKKRKQSAVGKKGVRSTSQLKNGNIQEESQDVKKMKEDMDEKNLNNDEYQNKIINELKVEECTSKQTNIKKKSYRCNVCKQEFRTKGLLTSHKVTCIDETSFKCDVCNKEFLRASIFAAHKLLHTDEKLYMCDVCGKRFTVLKYLKIHSITHSDDMPYECNVCYKEFKTQSKLNYHKQRHVKKKPYKCDVCNKEYVRKSELAIHKYNHTDEKPFSCDLCDKKFTTLPGFANHKLTHTGEKRFKCDVCGKMVQTKSSLKQHSLIHTGERPYKCNICGKRFRTSGARLRHKRFHMGIKLYKCDVCNKDFTTSSHVIRHKRSMHESDKK